MGVSDARNGKKAYRFGWREVGRTYRRGTVAAQNAVAARRPRRQRRRPALHATREVQTGS